MPKGSGKLKVAGIIETVTTSIVTAYFIYALIRFISNTSGIAAYRVDDRNTIIVAVVLFLMYHIYRLIISIFTFRKSDRLESSGAILGNCIALLVMSIIWFLIVLAAVSSANDTVNTISDVKTILVFLLLLAITDIVLLIIMIVGAAQNRQRPNMYNPWMQNPYNNMPMGAPYGNPNPYGMPGQPPFGAPGQQPFGTPGQPPYGGANAFGNPLQPPQPPFGAPNPNMQFGGPRPPYPDSSFGGQPPFADPGRVGQFANQGAPQTPPPAPQHMQPDRDTVSITNDPSTTDNVH